MALTIIERDRTVRWYRVTKDGESFRFRAVTDQYGTLTFEQDGTPVSPPLHGPAAIRGWLLRNGYTPEHSQSPEWAAQLAAARTGCLFGSPTRTQR